MTNFVDSVVRADGLAPLCTRSQTSAVMTKICSRVYMYIHVYTGQTLEWLTVGRWCIENMHRLQQDFLFTEHKKLVTFYIILLAVVWPKVESHDNFVISCAVKLSAIALPVPGESFDIYWNHKLLQRNPYLRYIALHIDDETKWPLCCRWYFHILFLEWLMWYYFVNVARMCSYLTISQHWFSWLSVKQATRYLPANVDMSRFVVRLQWRNTFWKKARLKIYLFKFDVKVYHLKTSLYIPNGMMWFMEINAKVEGRLLTCIIEV